MKKRLLLIPVLASAMFLAACGSGGGGEPLLIATQDLTLEANPATGPALADAFDDETFIFAGGVTEFGTAGTATSVTIEGDTSPAQATITAGGKSATAEMTFGSCIFRIGASDFTDGPLVTGNTITIAPCRFLVETRGQSANGQPQDRTARWVLNRATSNPTAVTITIDRDGTVRINGEAVGTVSVASTTGGTFTP